MASAYKYEHQKNIFFDLRYSRKVPQQVHYQHFCLYYVHIFAQTLSEMSQLIIVQNNIFPAPGSAPECLEGDRVDGSLVVAAEPLRVKLVGLRPVGGVQVEADLGREDV